jgi:uncharacterized protein YkwD
MLNGVRVRLAALVATVAALCLVVAPAAVPARSGHTVALSSLDVGVLDRLNEIREAHGLRTLRLSASLTEAAAEHSEEMGLDGYFEHDSQDGTAFWRRIARFYGSDGVGFWSVGENLLWSSPTVAPGQALELWMNSPEHRANILTARWREVGIAAVHVRGAQGIYHGLDVTIITTDFGVRH